MKVQSYVLIEHRIARKEQECLFSMVYRMFLSYVLFRIVQ